MIENITKSNVGSIIIGIICLVILMVLKSLNDRYKKKLPFPIPAEILVVSMKIYGHNT